MTSHTAFLLSFLIVAAQGVPAQVPAAADSAMQQIIDELGGTPLPLHQATELALQNATAVRISEAAWLAARGAARREAGFFDPTLFFNLNHVDREEPAASFFAGAAVLATKQTTTSGGVRMNLPIGTSIEASLNTIRAETNSSFAFLNPQYTAFGNLSVRQPLLGGLWISSRKNLEKADQEMDAARARYDQQVLAMSTEVELRYWELYAAERDYATLKLSRDRAFAFLKDTESRARAGLVGPNQVATARTFLAEQEIGLLDREEHLDRSSDQLASLMGERPGDPGRRFSTVDDPPEEVPVEDLDALLRQALENNLDLRAARADVEARRALSQAAFWEALPKIDLVGSLGGSGLSGTSQAVIFGSDTLRTTIGGNQNDAIREALKRNFPTWSVGVEVTLPIPLRSGLGEQDRLDAELIIAEQRQIQQERALEEQVRTGYRELSHGQRRLKAAREGVDAAQEQIRIGQIEFQNGRSTAFELVRLVADFAIAQQRYSQALVRSARAAATLRQLTSGVSR